MEEVWFRLVRLGKRGRKSVSFSRRDLGYSDAKKTEGNFAGLKFVTYSSLSTGNTLKQHIALYIGSDGSSTAPNSSQINGSRLEVSQFRTVAEPVWHGNTAIEPGCSMVDRKWRVFSSASADRFMKLCYESGLKRRKDKKLHSALCECRQNVV